MLVYQRVKSMDFFMPDVPLPAAKAQAYQDEAGQGGSIGHRVGPGHGAAEGWRVFNVVGLVNNGEPQTIGGKFGFIPKY